MPDEVEVIRVGRLEVRPQEFVAAVDGRALQLTVRELQLLTALARRRDRIVSAGKSSTPGSELIHTHYGFGYRFSPSLSQLFHTAATDR